MGLRNALLAVAFLGFVTAGTVAQDVKVDFDREADFAALEDVLDRAWHQLENPIQARNERSPKSRRYSLRRAGRGKMLIRPTRSS